LPTGALILVDARAPERFRGEVEPIDPVAGHVPGARNRPFAENLDAHGRFRPRDALRTAFRALLADAAPNRVIHTCGSGVNACHNLLAMEHAGLSGSRLYPGSWSEWIRDSSRPISSGPE
jgi:thiosulfate/3-mercaptopyruvate sulfurtransferase